MFHDYRAHGLSRERLESFADQLGWEAILNRRGTTWRKLPETVKQNIDRKTAIEVMLENPAIIKRPILDTGQDLLLGFDEARYQGLK